MPAKKRTKPSKAQPPAPPIAPAGGARAPEQAKWRAPGRLPQVVGRALREFAYVSACCAGVLGVLMMAQSVIVR